MQHAKLTWSVATVTRFFASSSSTLLLSVSDRSTTWRISFRCSSSVDSAWDTRRSNRCLRPRMTDRAISCWETTDLRSFSVSSSSLLLLLLFHVPSSLSPSTFFFWIDL